MPESIISQQELINAAADVATLSQIVNGTATPGTVTTRLGVALRTLLKLQNDVEAGVASAISAGLIKTTTPVTSTSNATDIDLDANDERVFTHTFTEDTTFTFSNPAATGTVSRFELWLTNDGTGRTPTWPAEVIWPYGDEPDLSVADEVNILVFSTIDGGTTWVGSLVAPALS